MANNTAWNTKPLKPNAQVAESKVDQKKAKAKHDRHDFGQKGSGREGVWDGN